MSQKRERVIIIGNRIGVKNPFPVPTYDKDNYITVSNTIGFLKDIPVKNNYKDDYIKINNREIYNHIASKNISDSFFKRKYKVDQKEISKYLKEFKKESKLSIKDIDNAFEYKHTAGQWFRNDKSFNLL